MHEVREVENLLIQCIYAGLIQGKLNQQAALLEVHSCIGRDIHPSELGAMIDTLGKWHENSVSLLSCVAERLGSYKAQCDARRQEGADLDARIDAVKATLAKDVGEGGGMSADFEAGMYEDEEKTRKGGRGKGKQPARSR